MIPGFLDWLNHRGSMLFQDWQVKEIFSTTEVFAVLAKHNYNYAIDHLDVPLPNDYRKGRWLWTKDEAMKVWHWGYEKGWFNIMSNQP
jgi:hypothetical protein